MALHRQLKTEEMDELLYMQQANASDEESGSGSDGERQRVRRERKARKGGASSI